MMQGKYAIDLSRKHASYSLHANISIIILALPYYTAIIYTVYIAII